MRHIVVLRGSAHVELEEHTVDEEVLRTELLTHPVLLPVEEFDVGGAMMIVGRESSLASGSADLIGLCQDGSLVIIEMKTGPKNSDFRRVLAQLLDYGSSLWEVPIEKFERQVLLPYLRGKHGPKGNQALVLAADIMSAVKAQWPDMEQADRDDLLEQLGANLAAGRFTYALVAQELTVPMERSIRYLNHAMTEARFYGVELTAFREANDNGEVAYAARTLVKPDAAKRPSPGTRTRADLVARFDEAHRDAVVELFEVADDLGLLVYVGEVGASIRLQVPDHEARVSVAWLFPPGHIGRGRRDLTLGYERKLEALPESGPRLKAWCRTAAEIPEATGLETSATAAVTLSPDQFVEAFPQIVAAFRSLMGVEGGRDAPVVEAPTLASGRTVNGPGRPLAEPSEC